MYVCMYVFMHTYDVCMYVCMYISIYVSSYYYISALYVCPHNKGEDQQAHKRDAQGQQPVPAMQRRALLPQGSLGQESAGRSPGVSICTFLVVLFY